MNSVIVELRSRAVDADVAEKFLTFIKPADAGESLSVVLSRAADHIERMYAALAPFAYYFDLNDCKDRADDEAMEVQIGDLRRAAAALTSAQQREDGK